MTMDVYQRTIRADSSPPISVDDFRDVPPTAPPPMFQPTTAKKPAKAAKRSFDVAFLMAPDDLSKKRNHANGGGSGIADEKADVKKPFKYSPPSESDLYRNYIDGRYQMNPLSLTMHHERLTREEPSRSPDSLVDQKEPFFVRSAFTKVTNSSGGFALESMIPRTPPIAVSPSSVSSTASNRSGVSPDLTYQDSLSPQPFRPLNRSPVQMISSGACGSPGKQYQNTVMPNAANLQYFVASQLSNPLMKEMKNEEKFSIDETPVKSKLKPIPVTKQNFAYHADNLSIPYTGFPMSAFPFTPTLSPAASTPVPMFPTGANLTAALLPPSYAALSLPAQNVCAKCNMHFRMTSDLVYHMRSHHKNENNVVDPYKRRRDQDKLKCPVCNESFRERHHLTRHMTAHQDKEDEESGKEFVDVTNPTPVSGTAK